MTYFESLTDVLSSNTGTVKVFFRNDDGGWADTQLERMCLWFKERELPLDIAVIPQEMDSDSVSLISKWINDENSKVNIHQHGYTHKNHQLQGRGCEFGSDRDYEQQYNDISRGLAQLQQHFGTAVDPVFTPPWNRCTDDTVVALQKNQFKYISRIAGSAPLDALNRGGHRLNTLDVDVDWLKKTKGERLDDQALEAYTTNILSSRMDTKTEKDICVGIMLHHEHTHDQEYQLLDKLVDVLRESSSVNFCSMMECVDS